MKGGSFQKASQLSTGALFAVTWHFSFGKGVKWQAWFYGAWKAIVDCSESLVRVPF
jgi:hypothetical protein